MIWELYQNRRIDSATNIAQRASQKVSNVDARISACEDKIDSLGLVCQSMWELLSDHLQDPETALRAKMEEVDLRDGKKDGKMTRVSTTCKACSRPLHARHRRCMYCGQQAEAENILQG